jgi:hypothetical protein
MGKTQASLCCHHSLPYKAECHHLELVPVVVHPVFCIVPTLIVWWEHKRRIRQAHKRPWSRSILGKAKVEPIKGQAFRQQARRKQGCDSDHCGRISH